MRAKLDLLEDQYYHTVPVSAGDMLLFKQQTPHCGPQNSSDRPRVVVFDMLSTVPGDVKGQADYPVYIHMAVDAATGSSCSPEYRRSLEKSHEIMPHPLHHAAEVKTACANLVRMVQHPPTSS